MQQKKNPAIREGQRDFGAVNQIRTGDLVLTKDVLYHLSHNSIFRFPKAFILYHEKRLLSSLFPDFSSISRRPGRTAGAGAVNQIRTGDLVLTKDVLYHLSHNSDSYSIAQAAEFVKRFVEKNTPEEELPVREVHGISAPPHSTTVKPFRSKGLISGASISIGSSSGIHAIKTRKRLSGLGVIESFAPSV